MIEKDGNFDTEVFANMYNVLADLLATIQADRQECEESILECNLQVRI